MNTGKIDKNGIEMAVGDVVHFKAGNISGRGIVYQTKEPDGLSESDNFSIKDTREGKNFARTYPYYPDATYRIDVKEAFDEKTVELILRLINDKSVKLYGSNNSGNYMIQISRVIEIIQEA